MTQLVTLERDETRDLQPQASLKESPEEVYPKGGGERKEGTKE